MASPDVARLVLLLDTVEREGRHLRWTADRLLSEPVDATWVDELESDSVRAERLDAFVSRFARMQDTLGDRLIPELRRHLLETPQAALDNLNRMEKLGLLRSVVDWVEARNLRNGMVHEYMRDPLQFAATINRARELVPLLVETYNTINRYAHDHFADDSRSWPPVIGDR